jgi:hypothetical protein
MLLQGDLFAWLQAEAGVEPGRQLQGGMVELSQSASNAVMSGQLVAKILAGHIPDVGGAGGSAEAKVLKQVAAKHGQGPGAGNAPSERLYSWNMLSPVLARLRVSLSADDKTLIVAGDEEVCTLLCVVPCPPASLPIFARLNFLFWHHIESALFRKHSTAGKHADNDYTIIMGTDCGECVAGPQEQATSAKD